MDLFLLLLLIFALAVTIPTGIAYLLYRFLKTRISRKLALTVASLPVLIVSYFIFTAVYPNDDFYEEEFTRITSLSYPEDAEIINKDATYPDQFGDYASCARIEVQPATYDLIEAQVRSDSRFSPASDSLRIMTSASDNVEYKLKSATYKTQFTRVNSKNGAYMFIGFLTDHKTIIIERSSS
jgi:hypothetical protein